jgi:antitoxin MazE
VRVRVRKWGNSASVRIPATLMRATKLALDETVDIHEERGKIVIEPIGRTEYDINELVAGITPANRHEEISFGPPVGREQL